MRLLIVLAVAMPLAFTGCAAQTESSSAQQQSPNIIVLFTDDMGWGDLSSYGAPEISTPNLDRMAAEGTRFTSFYVASWCVPSRTQLLTGRYRIRTGISGTGSNGTGGISDEEITLAESLQEQGYYTQMIGKWHLGHAEDRYLPPNHGFDDWWGLPYSNDYKRPWVQTDVPLQLFHNFEPIEHPVNQNTLTTRYTERAVDLIRSDREEPFFLYLAYAMPHLPVHTAEKFQGKSGAGRYADVIETIDWSAGQILQALEDEGIDEETMVVFMSDNGPWLNTPDRMLQAGNKRWHVGSPGPFRGYKATTYEGGPRVPGIIRWPGEVPAGRTTSEIFSVLDLYPTIMAAVGADMPDELPFDGQNQLPFLRGETDEARDVHFYEFRGRIEAVRSGPWKLRVPSDDDAPPVQLFHLKRDPGERFNVAEDHPGLVDSLQTMIDDLEGELGVE